MVKSWIISKVLFPAMEQGEHEHGALPAALPLWLVVLHVVLVLYAPSCRL